MEAKIKRIIAKEVVIIFSCIIVIFLSATANWGYDYYSRKEYAATYSKIKIKEREIFSLEGRLPRLTNEEQVIFSNSSLNRVSILFPKHTQLKIKFTEYYALGEKKNSASSRMLIDGGITKNVKSVTFFLLILTYPFRFFTLLVIWAFRTLNRTM